MGNQSIISICLYLYKANLRYMCIKIVQQYIFSIPTIFIFSFQKSQKL